MRLISCHGQSHDERRMGCGNCVFAAADDRGWVRGKRKNSRWENRSRRGNENKCRIGLIALSVTSSLEIQRERTDGNAIDSPSSGCPPSKVETTVFLPGIEHCSLIRVAPRVVQKLRRELLREHRRNVGRNFLDPAATLAITLDAPPSSTSCKKFC